MVKLGVQESLQRMLLSEILFMHVDMVMTPSAFKDTRVCKDWICIICIDTRSVVFPNKLITFLR